METVLDRPVARAESRGVSQWFAYLYLLRVQLIAAAILVLGPPMSLSSPLLNGIFDLDYNSNGESAVSSALVSLAAFSTSWTVLASSWTTLFNAPARFGAARVPFVQFPIQWPKRELFGVMALSPITVVIIHSSDASKVSKIALLLGALVGLAAAVVLVLLTNRLASKLQADLTNPRIRRFDVRVFRWLVHLVDRSNVREGFLDHEGGPLRPGHMVVGIAFLMSLSLYIVIGLARSQWIGYQTHLSTLACVLLLILMLCWFLGGLAFFFDRYRIPVLAIVVALLFVIGLFPIPGSDYTYRTWLHPAGKGAYANDVLNSASYLSTTPIVIAATGGGIQAAAWTARVLTGIDAELPTPELRNAYTNSIRMISSVSGGGVGAMYFSEAYSGPGGFQHDQLQNILAKAEASSLDDVAWGAVYPDFIGILFPPIRLWLGDRGRALERAWTRDPASGNRSIAALMADWREQVWDGSRPANIFNATVVDTGERLLLGTSRVGWSDKGHPHKEYGSHNYEDLYGDRAVQVVTAARLAASFTYVSPAARPDVGAPPFHIVDGGYYDDYGMTTLTEWLDEALDGLGAPYPDGSFKRILVIQIRASPGEDLDNHDPTPGLFYQSVAPVETLLNVRSTGQIAHNDEGFARLQRLWQAAGVEIDSVIFRFCGNHPPLSWHLTGRDKAKIDMEWSRQAAGPPMKAVRDFLAGRPIESTDSESPNDAALVDCHAQ